MRVPRLIPQRVAPLAAAFAAGAATILALAARWLSTGARTARAQWKRRPGAGAAELRARGRTPLQNLYDVHPEALNAAPRELGLRTIPTAAIKGTAVQGPQQRGGDFLPLPAFRSRNWASRWQRIRSAIESLTVLPPIEVVRYGDDYWVTDGHNRVAAALYYGQVGVDALVTELRPPGGRFERPQPGMAGVLAEGRALRAAGQGRLASTTALPLTDAQVDPGDSPIRDETAASYGASRRFAEPRQGPPPDGSDLSPEGARQPERDASREGPPRT